MTLIRFNRMKNVDVPSFRPINFLTEYVKTTPTQAVFVPKDCCRDLTNQRRSVCCNVSENYQLHASIKKVEIQCVAA